MNIAYFDCFAGAGGDMILGSLVDAGLSVEEISTELSKLNLSGYRLHASQAKRGALGGTHVKVALDEQPVMHRTLKYVADIIASSSLPQPVKDQGIAIFQRLASAEARVHRVPLEEVHFHEMGAVDTIVDIVGAAIGLHLLDIQKVYCSPLPVAGGAVDTAHGTLPLPAPATLELIAMAGAPVRPAHDPNSGELVTPTAAAILTTLASFSQPAFTLRSVGYGIGTRESRLPNVLRLWIGEAGAPETNDLLLMETNIDDMSPQLHGYVMERLFEQGARDVWFTPIQMKKNRPAVMLSVLSTAETQQALLATILRETSTLGVRVQPVQRHETDRSSAQVNTTLGEVRVKVKRLAGETISVSPEYEDCRRLALEHNLPLQEILQTITAEATYLLKRNPKTWHRFAQ